MNLLQNFQSVFVLDFFKFSINLVPKRVFQCLNLQKTGRCSSSDAPEVQQLQTQRIRFGSSCRQDYSVVCQCQRERCKDWLC